MDPLFLPTLNALLNSLAAVLLLVGRLLVRRGRIDAHRRVMLAAFGVSTAFLISYVIHKSARGFENTTFHATGTAKAAYLVMLFSHVSLAMTVPIFAILLIRLGLRGEIERHRRLARWGFPIWMYVSLTGVLVYLLLYHANPAAVASQLAPIPSVFAGISP